MWWVIHWTYTCSLLNIEHVLCCFTFKINYRYFLWSFRFTIADKDVLKPKSEEDGSTKKRRSRTRTHSRWSVVQNPIRPMIFKFFRCEKKMHGTHWVSKTYKVIQVYLSKIRFDSIIYTTINKYRIYICPLLVCECDKTRVLIVLNSFKSTKTEVVMKVNHNFYFTENLCTCLC